MFLVFEEYEGGQTPSVQHEIRYIFAAVSEFSDFFLHSLHYF